MKKIVCIILIGLLSTTVLAGCGKSKETENEKTEEALRAEIRAELEEEMKAEKEPEEKEAKEINENQIDENKSQKNKKDISKKESKDIDDLDSIYEFLTTLNSEVTKEDFDKNWEKSYMDITGDGSDEVVIFNEAGMNDDVYVIDVQDGDYVTIKSNMETTKSDEKIWVEQGFILNLQTTGGTGAYYEDMKFYQYKDGELIQVLDLPVGETVSSRKTNYEKTSKMDGDLANFEYTYTKEENGETTIEEHARYTYDWDKMTFDIEDLNQSKESEEQTIHIKDLGNGMNLNGGVIKDYEYIENDKFGLTIAGEFEQSGWVSYNDFFQSIIFSAEENFDTKIIINNDVSIEGIQSASFRNNSEFIEMIGRENYNKLTTEPGSELYITLRFKNFQIKGKYESGLGESIEAVEIIEVGDFK